MSAEARQRIDQYWAEELAISPDLLHSQALMVAPLPASSASFCFVFQRQAFTCVRVPPSYYENLHQACALGKATPPASQQGRGLPTQRAGAVHA